VGSIEVGKVADLVCFTPEYFGSKPELILKAGIIVWGQMGMLRNKEISLHIVLTCVLGDANGSIPTTEPIISRPMYGANASSLSSSCFVFVSQLSVDEGVIESYHLRKKVEPVKGCRTVGKKDMRLNDAMPKITVDPETYKVQADGYECVCDPVSSLPLTQSVYLF
jgi:urease